MKKVILAVAAVFFGMAVSAQSISIYSGAKEKLNFSPEEIDSIVFNKESATGVLTARLVKGTWCSVGTSITWYNDNVDFSKGRFTRGYQDRVMDKLAFDDFINVGDNGGIASGSINRPKKADYYSIEHGINDWGKQTPVGTFDDYLNNTGNSTFAGAYRLLIDKIYSLNPNAKIVLCTPRKAYGFDGYLPAHWYDAKPNGVYLKDYVDIIKKIAEYESLPVADFFNECGGQNNLARLSIDTALHPNDDGYQLMANVLVKAFEKIIVD
ncbi:MAG: SGNH/GDSL hydrolase family protein [Muribaculaceae bacterium]|nr:SGNH/GDSL hydrolase family protein [Muribaculaceae bacterium]